MNSLMVILLLAGIALLIIEVITPGGILGTLGVLSMIGAVAIAFSQHGPRGGFAMLGLSVVILGIGLYVEFRVLPRTALGKKLFLHSSVTGKTSEAAEAGSLVGRQGQAVTALAPTGLVLVDGRKYEAASRSGFLDSGTAVVVRGTDNFRIIVEKS